MLPMKQYPFRKFLEGTLKSEHISLFKISQISKLVS
jgi:hypothetical protein